MEDFNFDNLNQRITDIQATNSNEEKTRRVARLIILLTKIEKELKTVEQTLEKLWDHGYKQNNDNLKKQCNQKIATVKQLKNKIAKARLNLNYYFI